MVRGVDGSGGVSPTGGEVPRKLISGSDSVANAANRTFAAGIGASAKSFTATQGPVDEDLADRAADAASLD